MLLNFTKFLDRPHNPHSFGIKIGTRSKIFIIETLYNPFQYTDYHLVAEGFGAKGIIIKKENEDNLKEVFIKAQQLNEEGYSVCINAVIGKSKFREGSISV